MASKHIIITYHYKGTVLYLRSNFSHEFDYLLLISTKCIGDNDDSHEISFLIVIFAKTAKFEIVVCFKL